MFTNKITKITERLPKETILPDGLYHGVYGGYVITIHYEGKYYELTTEEGVRGVGFKVIVCIKDGVATFQELEN